MELKYNFLFLVYSVELTPSDGSRKRQTNIINETFPSDVSSGIVTGLSSGVAYIVNVLVTNDVETSTSVSITVQSELVVGGKMTHSF